METIARTLATCRRAVQSRGANSRGYETSSSLGMPSGAASDTCVPIALFT